MTRLKTMIPVILLGLTLAAALEAQDAFAANPRELYERAKRAIASGNVVPERDLAPLVAVLRGPSSEEDLRTAIDKIEDLADAGGASPADVKHYLLGQSTPLLLKIGATGPSVFSRGEAVMALRGMGASRAVLDQAATIAEHDRDDFVRSRGEILRNFMKSMPAAGAAADVKSGGPREQQAIASLKARKLGVSADQLRRSSLEGNATDVQSLIDAGVNVNSGSTLGDSALYFAVFSGCGGKQGENDGLVNTVNVLVAAGADVKRKDDNGNNILMSAAQMCGPRIVTALIAAGADMKITNGSGMTPLGMALLMRHPDSAEVLVGKGARLTSSQAKMLDASVTDPRAKAIIQKAR
jgi:hypothetical protein